MPKVVIKQKTSVTPADAFRMVKTMLADDKDLKKLDSSYKCSFDETALTGSALGKLFKADMQVRSLGSGCEVEIVVDLPLALSLAKGMVQKTLEKKLNESLS